MTILNKIILTIIGTIVTSKISRDNVLRNIENTHDIVLRKSQFPNITILLPTLNEEWMIEKTLQSIKNQNIYQLYHDKFEILVIDSESNDNTIQIASKYVDKIITISERNLVLARTIGINQSKGDIIVFIDADTLYPVNWLNYMLKHYNNDNSVVAVSGPEFHPNIGITRDIFEPILINFNIKKSNEMIGHNSSCYKWAFNAVNGFNVPFNYDIKSSKDTQIVLETNFAKKLRTVGKYIYDKTLIVYDYGLPRRFGYQKELCKIIDDNNKYICKYWDERKNQIRF